jgi:acyl carrier protein
MDKEPAVTDQILFDQVVLHIGNFLKKDMSHLKLHSSLVREVEGLDSLMMYELLLHLSDRLDFELEDDAIDRIDTVAQLLDHISDHRRSMALPIRGAEMP